MNKILRQGCCVVMTIISISCNNSRPAVSPDESDILPASLENLTTVIIRDIYTPPVASRIYAYTHLAFYEGIRFASGKDSSITAQLNGFGPMPHPAAGKPYNFTLAGLTAFYEVGRKMVFSKDSLKLAQEQVTRQFTSLLPPETFQNSVALGTEIAEVIIRRSKQDHYDSTRGMPRFSVFKTEGKWVQTSPDYSDAVEPYWSSITPLLLDSAAQFKPARPPAYSLDTASNYYHELMEVYNVNRDLTPLQDTIATYWDDNAFVTKHEGHLMYANKKTTPVGHWMGITSILCRQQKKDQVESAKIYALTACAIFDGFISCWDEKFRSSTVRPITVIQAQMDPEWTSFLQTPPFPEYTSGHSVISGAAAAVLTSRLGDNIPFTDDTEIPYLGLRRKFSSINAAAEEAGISRLYGGIHFRAAIAEGGRQGKLIGDLYNSTF